ncbi:MAG TPA: addiction module toxin, HicA family, partial [Verrucomicrobia bacterium]|nr:addiction module toxin, HicA family [Verrucomicrobiota bacterium]
MSQRFPVCTAREVTRVLRGHSFSQVSQKGSHQKWRHPNGRQVIVADHGKKPLPIGTLKSIIEGSGLSVDEF